MYTRPVQRSVVTGNVSHWSNALFANMAHSPMASLFRSLSDEIVLDSFRFRTDHCLPLQVKQPGMSLCRIRLAMFLTRLSSSLSLPLACPTFRPQVTKLKYWVSLQQR